MLPVPTARMVVAAVVLSAAVLLLPLHPPAGLFVVDGILLAVAGVDALLAPDPGRVGIERTLPAALTIGAGGGEVQWRLHNPAGRRVRLSVADELAPSLHPGVRRFSVVIPPRATVTRGTRIDPVRRGRYDVRELVVRVDGPLGLASRQGGRALPSTLRVLPRFRSRQEAELRIERARLLEVGLRSAQGRGGGTEFDSLREYTEDDEFRRIDWAATARSGRTIVRTYRAERNQQVVVLLDCGRVMAGRLAGVPRLEWGMDAAMMLTAVAGRLGDRCGLVAFDRDVTRVVPPAAGAAQLGRVMSALYDLEPRLVESDYRGAFATTVARFRRRALLVLVTELTEEAVAETLVPELPLLLGRHLVVVASVTDPDVAGWAARVPTEPGTAFRSAAAVGALDRRADVAARLRALGASVIDAPPHELASRLADTYLHVKAAGRL